MKRKKDLNQHYPSRIHGNKVCDSWVQPLLHLPSIVEHKASQFLSITSRKLPKEEHK